MILAAIAVIIFLVLSLALAAAVVVISAELLSQSDTRRKGMTTLSVGGAGALVAATLFSMLSGAVVEILIPAGIVGFAWSGVLTLTAVVLFSSPAVPGGSSRTSAIAAHRA